MAKNASFIGLTDKGKISLQFQIVKVRGLRYNPPIPIKKGNT